MIDYLDWLNLECLYKITSGLNEEELNEIDEIRLKSDKLFDGDGYEKDTAYFNLGEDTICQIVPCCFVPMGKTYKKYYTQVIFSAGGFVLADGKPVEVYKLLNEYYERIGNKL